MLHDHFSFSFVDFIQNMSALSNQHEHFGHCGHWIFSSLIYPFFCSLC